MQCSDDVLIISHNSIPPFGSPAAFILVGPFGFLQEQQNLFRLPGAVNRHHPLNIIAVFCKDLTESILGC
jgi:hypothetical protein